MTQHAVEPGALVCETARLRLRRFTLDDADAAFLLRQVNEPSWIRNIGDRKVHSLEDARQYIATRTFEQYRRLGYGMNVIERRADGSPVGCCGLVKRDALPHPDLGFALLEEFWGQGYAREAAAAVIAHARAALDIARLLAITTPVNERSGHLLLQVGFHPEGMVRLEPGAEELRLYST